MAVEILVLSGARQGERIGFDTTEFRAGAESDCAVYFDPRIDAGAANRSVTLRLMDDGWYVVRAAHGVLVNQQAVAPPVRVRSGDVVRMSERGPDFSFSIVARLSAAPAMSPAVTPMSPAMTPGYAGGTASPWAAPLAMTQAAPLLTPAPTPLPAAFPAAQPAGFETPAAPIVVSDYVAPAPVAVQPVEQVARAVVPASGGAAGQPWLLLLGGALVACVLVVVLVRVLSPQPPSQPQQPTTVVVKIDGGGGSGQSGGSGERSGEQVTKITAANGNTGDSTPPKPPIVKPKPPAVEERIYEQLKDAVYLIQVEKSGSYWPVATCCAVGDNTLLTTAREASDLAAWRNDPQTAFKVWITRPSDSADEGEKESDSADKGANKIVKLEVKDIRVHTGYAVFADKPEWIYCDVGLLTVEGKLPKVASLASAKELDELKDGQPVFCFGFPHEGEKVTEFDQVEPQLSRSKIFVTTVQRKLPGQPRLLHVKGEIRPIACGSPIVNDQGKVLAVYGAAAVVPEGASEKDAALVKNLHYAPGVDPELIEKWLKQQDSTTWITPPARKTSPEPKDHR